MSFTVEYKTLFEIRIIHHYFLDNGEQLFDKLDDSTKNDFLTKYHVHDFINIVPTESCDKILKNLNCIYKNTSTGLIVKIQVKKQNDKYVPCIDIDKDVSFRFRLEFIDINFNNYTSLPLDAGKKQIFYFQTRFLEKARKLPFLSQCPFTFAEDEYHAAGDMLVNNKDNPTQLYIAKKATDVAPPSADWINDPLVNSNILFYANKNDLLRVENDFLIFPFQQSNLDIPVSIRNVRNENFKPDYTVRKDNNLTELTVNLKNLPEDVYYINMEPYKKEFPFFLMKEKNAETKGIIEISAQSNNKDFNILNDDNTLKEQIFELRFKNRYTLWKFFGKDFSNNPTSGPHPLTKYGFINVSVLNSNGQNIDELPNPSVHMIKIEYDNTIQQAEESNETNDEKSEEMELQKEDKFYNILSEIYIN